MCTPDGATVGTHMGLAYYTLGQRRGLGLGGRRDGPEAAWFVVGKDTGRNVLVVAQGDDHPDLYTRTVTATQPHWIAGAPSQLPLRCAAKSALSTGRPGLHDRQHRSRSLRGALRRGTARRHTGPVRRFLRRRGMPRRRRDRRRSRPTAYNSRCSKGQPERRGPMPDSFKARTTLRAGGARLRHPRTRCGARHRSSAPALFAQGPAREPAPPRGRREHHARRTSRRSADWDPKAEPSREIAFTPARVIMQDFTGVPAVVDLAAMRDAVVELGGTAERINPLSRPSSSSIIRCRSTYLRHARRPRAATIAIEFERNKERYAFLRWGQNAFDNFRSSRRTPASSIR